MEYQKLVRDRIPELIAAGGETPVIRVLEDGEYLSRLEDKLEEEVAEYRQSGEPEELADILEVVYALGAARGVSEEALTALRDRKREARGGFSGRIFLIRKV